MSGTNASLTVSGGIALPVPTIRLAQVTDANLDAYRPTGANFTVSQDGSKIGMKRCPLFVAKELDASLFDQDLRLEVLWYKRRALRAQGGSRDGYFHPTHQPQGNQDDNPMGSAVVAPVLPNSRFRGGDRAGGGGFVTEWSITGNGQKFFIDSLGRFFKEHDVFYIDVAGVTSPLSAFVPTSIRTNGSGGTNPTGFGYASQYRPNYFKFRFSVQDPNDPRSRITGPETPAFVMGAAVHPFVQDVAASQAAGAIRHIINPAFQKNMMNVWINTRIPSA